MININYTGKCGTGVGAALNSLIEMITLSNSSYRETKFIYLIWDESSEFAPLIVKHDINTVSLVCNDDFCYELFINISKNLSDGNFNRNIFLLKAWELNPDMLEEQLSKLTDIDKRFSTNDIRVCLIKKSCSK